MTEKEFSIETIKYVDKADLSHRKKFGQYFTPKFIRDELINNSQDQLKIKSVRSRLWYRRIPYNSKEYFKSPNFTDGK